MESTTIDPHLIERPRAPRRLLVTGANGYIGRRLVAAACELGYEVVAGVRQPSDFSMSGVTRSSPFDLATPETGDLLHGVDAVIHLAAIVAGNSRPPGVDEDLNVSGTRQLVLAARARGIQLFGTHQCNLACHYGTRTCSHVCRRHRTSSNKVAQGDFFHLGCKSFFPIPRPHSALESPSR